MPRTGDSDSEIKQRGGYSRFHTWKPLRSGPDPIQKLRTDLGDATVEVYGDATLQAIDEHGDVANIPQLLSDVRPLATLNLGALAPVEANVDLDDYSLEDRLKAVSTHSGGEEHVEARYFYEAHDQNGALLIYEIDSDE